MSVNRSPVLYCFSRYLIKFLVSKRVGANTSISLNNDTNKNFCAELMDYPDSPGAGSALVSHEAASHLLVAADTMDTSDTVPGNHRILHQPHPGGLLYGATRLRLHTQEPHAGAVTTPSSAHKRQRGTVCSWYSSCTGGEDDRPTLPPIFITVRQQRLFKATICHLYGGAVGVTSECLSILRHLNAPPALMTHGPPPDSWRSRCGLEQSSIVCPDCCFTGGLYRSDLVVSCCKIRC